MPDLQRLGHRPGHTLGRTLGHTLLTLCAAALLWATPNASHAQGLGGNPLGPNLYDPWVLTYDLPTGGLIVAPDGTFLNGSRLQPVELAIYGCLSANAVNPEAWVYLVDDQYQAHVLVETALPRLAVYCPDTSWDFEGHVAEVDLGDPLVLGMARAQAARQKAAYSLDLYALIDPFWLGGPNLFDGEVEENGIADTDISTAEYFDNLAQVTLPHPVIPLSNELYLGAQRMTLTAPMTAENTDVPACPGGVLLTSGHADYDPDQGSARNDWQNVRFTIGAGTGVNALPMLCAVPDLARATIAGVPLVVSHAVAVGSKGVLVPASLFVFGEARGEIDGFGMTVDFHLNTTGNGLTLVEGELRLPRGVAYHRLAREIPSGVDSRRIGFDSPRGLASYPLVFEPFPGAASFGDLQTVTDRSRAGFLTSERLPFAVAFDQITVFTSQTPGSRVLLRRPTLRWLRDPQAPGLSGRYAPLDRARNRALEPTAKPITNDVIYSRVTASCILLTAQGLFASTGLIADVGDTHFPRAKLGWTERSPGLPAAECESRAHEYNPDLFDVQYSRLVARDHDPFGQSTVRALVNQRADCSGCGSATADVLSHAVPREADAPALYRVSASGTLTFDGAFASTVQWGPKRTTDNAPAPRTFSYNPTVDRAHVVVPGFVVNAPVVTDFLAASFDEMGSPTLAGEDAWRRGNGFFAGLTVGPEVYRDDAGQPQIGAGSTLANKPMDIAFGGPRPTPTVTTVQTSPGAKLVLRQAGATGVFNFTQTPTVTVYGFPLSLTRFAFAMVNNVGQKVSWVDGQLDLPPWAGFSVPFSSLELQCTGHMGGGLVDQGRLANLPENKKRLTAWHAPYAIAEVAFAPVPPANQCSAGDRVLQTGGPVTVAALAKPIDLVSFWTADGAPAAQPAPKLTGQALVEFARPNVPNEFSTGFFLDAMADKVALARTPGASYGNGSRAWFELGGKLRLPFWKSPDVTVRLQNKLDGVNVVAERTLVRGPNANSTLWQNGNDHPLLWQAVTAAKAPTNDATQAAAWAEAKVLSPFPWVFDDLVFPMRWNPDDKGRPRFVQGGEMKSDLGIISVEASAQSTTVRDTEIKFGASASLDIAAAVSLPTNLDIFSQESVGKIDEMLRDITGNANMKCPDQQAEATASGPLWCVVKYIKRPSDFIARTVGPMFSNFIQSQVSWLVEKALGPVLDEIASLITTIQAAPMAVVNAGLAELTKAIDAGLAALTTPLSTEVRAFNDAVPLAIENAVARLSPSDPLVAPAPLPPSLRGTLHTMCGLLAVDGRCGVDLSACGFTGSPSPVSLGRAIEDIKTLAGGITNKVTAVGDELDKQAVNIEKTVKVGRCLVSGLRSALAPPPTDGSPRPLIGTWPGCATELRTPSLAPIFDALVTAENTLKFFSCKDGRSENEIFKKVGEIADAINQVLGAVESDAIPSTVSGVGSFVGADLSTFTQALKEIGGYAKSIRARLNTARAKIEGGFCEVGGGIDKLVAPVRELLAKLDGPLEKVESTTATLKTKFTAIKTEVTKRAGEIGSRIDSVGAFMASLQSKVGEPIRRILELDAQVCAGATELPSIDDIATIVDSDCDNLRCVIKARIDEAVTAIGIPGLVLVDPDPARGTIVDRLAKELKAPIYNVIKTVQNEVGLLFDDLIKQIPFPTRDELRQKLVNLVVNSSFIRDLDKLIEQNIRLILEEVDKVAARLVEQLNGFVRKAIELVNAKIRELLEGITAEIEGAVGFTGAALDGYAKIVGNTVQLLQIDARFDNKPSKGSGDEDKRKDEDQSFRASLVMKSWALSDKGKNCGFNEEQAAGMLDASIGVYNVPFTFGGEGGLKIQELSFGFTLEDTTPVGFNGALITTGMIDFKAFSIRDIRFLAGFGKHENYLGASAAANFSGYDMSVAFLVGKTCDPTILTTLDPQFAGFVKIPAPGAFEGGYVRGSASIPVFNFGCFFKVGFGADFGAWFLNRAVGGLIGGSVFGQIACLVSVRGTVRMALTYNTSDGSVFFKGQGWCAAGIGGCSPEKWLTVEDSRDDGFFCFTMDALMDAEYEDAKGFNMLKLDVTGPH